MRSRWCTTWCCVGCPFTFVPLVLARSSAYALWSTMRKSMWRPEIAGLSMQKSHAGWRPTTVTSLVSSISATIAPSRLTTTRARMSPLSSEARGRGARRLQLVVDAFHTLDRACDFASRCGLGLRAHDTRELRHAAGAFHREARVRGALFAPQRRAHAPLERQVLHPAHGLGRLLEAFLLHHARDFLDAFVHG